MTKTNADMTGTLDCGVQIIRSSYLEGLGAYNQAGN